MIRDPIQQYQLTTKRHLQQLQAVSFIRQNSRYSIDEVPPTIYDEDYIIIQQKYSIEYEAPFKFQFQDNISYSNAENDLELFSSSDSCNCEQANKYHSKVQQQQLIFRINLSLLAYE
ncbi:Hypothetical_protein [Hexamita inflata]|uniref:Hypothetical_protein n=1 Tax=Hexamita inflata TaxID=28002 RepID=A0AA86NQQ9_9EUKA|nr:Hypothetical protein HINF_LOCUS10805 [Hexamita inflata]